MRYSRYKSFRFLSQHWPPSIMSSCSTCCVCISSAASLGMWSMPVGQTIGRLCQPARDMLGGLLTLKQHLNSMYCIFHQPSLYTMTLKGERMAAIFYLYGGLSVARFKLFSWCSMQLSNAVLSAVIQNQTRELLALSAQRAMVFGTECEVRLPRWSPLHLVKEDELQGGGISPCFNIYQDGWLGSSLRLSLTTTEQALSKPNGERVSLAWINLFMPGFQVESHLMRPDLHGGH